jgi:hypothetical protein
MPALLREIATVVPLDERQTKYQLRAPFLGWSEPHVTSVCASDGSSEWQTQAEPLGAVAAAEEG